MKKEIKLDFNRYNNANVYKLISDVDDYFYIGSTCTSLSKRINAHKSNSKNYPEIKVYAHFNMVGWENVKIILISEHYLDNKEQLLREENNYIKMHKNDKFCLNTKKAWVGLELNEYRKQYVEEHTEELREKKKQYYKENTEQLKEKAKQYHENNKKYNQ